MANMIASNLKFFELFAIIAASNRLAKIVKGLNVERKNIERSKKIKQKYR